MARHVQPLDACRLLIPAHSSSCLFGGVGPSGEWLLSTSICQGSSQAAVCSWQFKLRTSGLTQALTVHHDLTVFAFFGQRAGAEEAGRRALGQLPACAELSGARGGHARHCGAARVPQAQQPPARHGLCGHLQQRRGLQVLH